ncbi:TRAP transporter small permease subunit [Halomonas vilamensis]|uniref:TRAP transporter small permease protein n=1 Tax=Vreelandella vilamensis TaxID=531309 RepID=A0ABU1H001_9GAMM|nr:TRAP transporter small permease subunit [Halomonas vilamensis]MDR5897634.1 TRAP transporter small permease subunit [Halomonas vilamensis]
MLQRLSTALARVEEMTAAALAAVVTCLILTNIAFRVVGSPLYWISELSIYAMIWMTFLIASAVLKRRQGIAVTLLPEALSQTGRKLIMLWVDGMVLLFALAMVGLCWQWYQPLTLARLGFDTQAFQGETFNFIYAENTSTLGIKKFWFWLIVPWFALSLTLHSIANFVQGLWQWRDPTEGPGAETLP